MLTVRSATRNINQSAKRIVKALGLRIDRPRHRYFGITMKRWFYNVLLANRELYNQDNYGRQKEWIVVHKFWRSFAELPYMNLEPEYLLHYSMWEIMPVQRGYSPAIALNRYDCVMIKRLENAFDRIYRGLFVEKHGKRQKYNKINKLVRELLNNQGYVVKCRQIRALFAEYNHIVIRKGEYLYYNNLNVII